MLCMPVHPLRPGDFLILKGETTLNSSSSKKVYSSLTNCVTLTGLCSIFSKEENVDLASLVNNFEWNKKKSNSILSTIKLLCSTREWTLVIELVVMIEECMTVKARSRCQPFHLIMMGMPTFYFIIIYLRVGFF